MSNRKNKRFLGAMLNRILLNLGPIRCLKHVLHFYVCHFQRPHDIQSEA